MNKNRTNIEGLNIEWFGHTTIGIYGKKIIYLDPFSEVLKEGEQRADLIISTHGHRDHFDIKAINRLSKETTSVIIKSGCDKSDLKSALIHELDVGEVYTLDDIEIKGVHAYNIKRFRSPGVPFHPEGFGMGILLTVEQVKFYYAGDTDFIPPMEELKDEKLKVAFLPIGGTYTMDVDEAVEAALSINSEIVIPVHYNFIEGTEADPKEFKDKVEEKGESKVIILSTN